MITGIHHITAISSNAQRTYDFYTGILGLRLIKKTVNFDAPDTYHLYFGNETGTPGTALTFFPFVDAGTGRRGPGLATKIQFAVPAGALGFWLARFVEKGVKHSNIKEIFGLKTIEFRDFDDQLLELVAHPEHNTLPAWTEDGIGLDDAIRGFFGIELTVHNIDTTKHLLANLFGYQEIDTEDNITRFAIDGEKSLSDKEKLARHIDVFSMPGWPEGQSGAGTIHHVAFRAKDDNHELALRNAVIEEFGLQPTEVIDRYYFHSVYFREPNGILFEIATDQPGFTIDEPVDELGTQIKFPPQYRSVKKAYLAQLPELHTKGERPLDIDIPKFEFKHRFINRNSEYTFVLLHGTGGDEYDLIPLTTQITASPNILTLRGNVREDGMNRFFKRTESGEFVRESLDTETKKLADFLNKTAEFYELDKQKFILLGLSNGANIGMSLIIQYPDIAQNLIALHGMQPFDLAEFNPDLKNHNILLTTGENDPFVTPAEIFNLKNKLTKWGAKTKLFTHQGGHELRVVEIDEARKFVKNLTKS